MRIALGAAARMACSLLAAGTLWATDAGASETRSGATAVNPADELVGLWKAQHHYGPEARGRVVIQNSASGWSANFAGRDMAVEENDRVLTFELPNGRGGFRARMETDGSLRRGQWFQPSSPRNPPFGTNIVFRPDGPGRWRGEVRPIEDLSTFFLLLRKRPDGSVGALVRNREFNLGVRYNADRIEREGDALKVIGRFRGREADSVLMKGDFRKRGEGRGDDVLNLEFDPPLDGVYTFARVGDESDFYPRGRNPGRYVYRPPAARDDGWPVATLGDVNIDRKGMEDFVQMLLDMPMDSLDVMQVDAILVARHGKLVLEEYFHGFDADTTHSTRSAGKSLTAVLAGAVMQAGLPVKLTSPVYRVMNNGTFPPGLAPHKRAMTLENLLTMSSGLFCDDGNPDAPGNEETMTNQDVEPDFYRFYMRVPMDRRPGEKAIYCSGDPNLVIGVLHRGTGEHPMDLFDRLIGEPMRISHHGWYVSPSRQPYGGGSINATPRHFMKLGQLMLNKGTWNGHRILSEAFVERSSAPLYDLNNIRYGYLWWVIDWPYKNRTVRAFFAGGNGGQGTIVIPELDTVISTWGSSYGTRTGLEIQQGLTPRYILPAIREPGDAKDAPVVPREYEVIYGRDRARVAPSGTAGNRQAPRTPRAYGTSGCRSRSAITFATLADARHFFQLGHGEHHGRQGSGGRLRQAGHGQDQGNGWQGARR